jgi:lysophospholipase L1-like esterase
VVTIDAPPEPSPDEPRDGAIEPAAPRRRRRLRSRAALAIASLGVSALALEAACQAYARLVVFPRWDATRAVPGHYYEPSEDPVLGYQPRRGYSAVHDGRRLAINAVGLREDGDERFADRRRVLMLGDSVVFGIGLDQAETAPARLQARLDPTRRRVAVLNGGLPGASLGELPRWLERIQAAYRAQVVLYVLNLNDLARRDTVREGADNGLYRMYCRPTLMTPWFLRKLVYRAHKGEATPSAGWYLWLAEGGDDACLPAVEAMAATTRAAGGTFQVVLSPTRAQFEDERVRALVDHVSAWIAARGIPVLDPSARFAADPEGLIDPTDHLTARGAEVLADALVELAGVEPSGR